MELELNDYPAPPESVTIEKAPRDVPIELPGRPYYDFFESLKAATESKGE